MKRLPLLLILLASFALHAQAPFAIHSLHHIRLPQGLDNLSTVDNHLFGYNHLLVSTPITEKNSTDLQPDTLWASLIPDADYIVRNPSDSILYFTRLDADGVTNLYTYTPNRLRKIHRINIHGWQRDICHPTFSPNGTMMIFASQGKVGLGGYDLWCSLWNGHRWTRPINLGNTINTPGNETNPVFYHNFLIFTSDSIPNTQPGRHLYAFHMRETSTIDEIIFDSYTIQPLPYPINSHGEDMNLAVHLPSSQGWWISSRSGKRELHTFSGELAGVLVAGTVADNHGRPIPNTIVKISLNGRTVANTTSDTNGYYQLYVLPNDDYILQASQGGHFNFEQEIPVIRTTERLLVNTLTQNIQLHTLPIAPIIIQSPFGQGTAIQLTPDGTNALKPIVNSLRDNPQIKATFTICYDKTDDNSFNDILINHRINTLQQYLLSNLPSDTQFSIKNGNNTEETTPSHTSIDAIFITYYE
jgi:hypothetical protein